MRKKSVCFILTTLLVMAASGTVLASDLQYSNNNINTLNNTAQYNSIQSKADANAEVNNESLQLLYAKLQLQQSEMAKQQAMNGLEQVSKIQEEQKLVAGFLNTARQCQAEAVSTDKETEMRKDMAEYMDANALAYDTTGNDLLMTGEEWGTAVTSLEKHLEQFGTQVQQQMVIIQDYMGQYNSSLQNTNTQIPNANQTLTNLARGQSMYGNSEVGLAITGLVVGLVLGCAITLAVQKTHRKKEQV